MTLEVRFESAAKGGLRVIKTIPALRPCRLEGQNGIGKSALVRLLLLASGRQPYPGDPGAWRSLKALVGPSVISVDGMEGDFSTVTLTLTPEKWPAQPTTDIGEWLGTAEFDGKPGPVSELFRVLVVIHLTGTEKLFDTLQHQYPRMAVDLTEMNARLDDLDEQRASLGELAEQLERLSPRFADSEHALVAEVNIERRNVCAQIEALIPVTQDLNKALGLATLLESGDADTQHRELLRLRSRLDTVRQEVPAAEAEYETAVAALDAGSDAQQQAAKLERRLRTLSKKYDQVLAHQADCATKLAQVGAPADVDVLDEGQHDTLVRMHGQALDHQRHERDQLARQRRNKEENDVLDEVRVVLVGAATRGLGDMVLAHINNYDVTVDDLYEALGRVADVETDVPPEGEAQALIEANAEVTEWATLVQVFTDKHALAASIKLAEEGLVDLAPKREEQDELQQAATTAREKLDEVESEFRSIQIEIGARQSNLGGMDVEDAREQVEEILSLHDVPRVDLPTRLGQHQAELHELQTDAQKLGLTLADLDDAATRRRVHRETLRRRAYPDEELAWLAELAATRTGGPGPDEEWDDETWQFLADHISGVRQALGELARDVSALHAVAGSRASKGRQAHALAAVIEQDAIALLSSAPIAQALFDGGRVERVSMDERTITWDTPAGERRTRPLSVFSSGEQAVGFMRAQLEEIASTPVPNRLVFLDEFGAFISADRRRPLADLLTSDDLGELADQVVVILPLQADYRAELEETTGQLHIAYEQRAAAVAMDGYFTEEFER